MTIGGITGSTRVNGARIRQYGKAGGARSGEQAGLGSTIGRTGWLINWIKRRVNSLASESVTQPSRSEQLSSAISAGDDLLTLVSKGFTTNDFIETLGFFGAADFVFKNLDDPRNLFANAGISNVALKNAGAINNGNGVFDFSNFSVKGLLTQNPNVRPTQVVITFFEGMKNIEGKSSDGNNLPLATKISVGKEWYDTYNVLSESQKTNLDIFLTRLDPSFADSLARRVFDGFFGLLR